MKPRLYAVLIAALVLIGLGAMLIGKKPAVAPTIDNTNGTVAGANNNTNDKVVNSNSASDTADTATTTFSTADLVARDPAFDFSASIPGNWKVEYIAGSQAVNIYDPAADGDTNLARSKIFIKYFRAAGFLTLQTVNIKSRTESTINGRPAVTYVIEKKAGVADFPSQPSWRNIKHRVTDIRSTDASPTVFYVVAKAPDVDDATFDAFLRSLTYGSTQPTSQVVYPLRDFISRVTKKRFGQLIDPVTSPVQPERFSGYHTGVDAEAPDGTDVPVFAIATGTVRLVRAADGYGGVMLVEHAIASQVVTAVYGHIRLTSVTRKAGESVSRGERIAVLGTGGTAETNGERQHLHFGLLKGKSTSLRGYVSAQSKLSDWEDPLEWLKGHNATEPNT